MIKINDSKSTSSSTLATTSYLDLKKIVQPHSVSGHEIFFFVAKNNV